MDVVSYLADDQQRVRGLMEQYSSGRFARPEEKELLIATMALDILLRIILEEELVLPTIQAIELEEGTRELEPAAAERDMLRSTLGRVCSDHLAGADLDLAVRELFTLIDRSFVREVQVAFPKIHRWLDGSLRLELGELLEKRRRSLEEEVHELLSAN